MDSTISEWKTLRHICDLDPRNDLWLPDYMWVINRHYVGPYIGPVFWKETSGFDYVNTTCQTSTFKATTGTESLWSSSSPSLQTLCHSGDPITNLWECMMDETHLPPSVNWRRLPPYIPVGLRWDCSNGTRSVSLINVSFTDIPWWPYTHFSSRESS